MLAKEILTPSPPLMFCQGNARHSASPLDQIHKRAKGDDPRMSLSVELY